MVGQDVIEEAMPVHRDRIPISIVIGVVIILMVLKDAVIAIARWGNLAMAGLWITVLVVYLISEHQRRG